MISDELDEDADNLDDDTALDSCHADLAAGRKTEVQPASTLPDWPDLDACRGTRSRRGVTLNIDQDILTWFRTRHTDWRRQMQLVLQAWVSANMTKQHPRPLLQLEHDPSNQIVARNNQPPAH